MVCQGHKKLGGSTGRTPDPDWPTGCLIPYDVMLSIEAGGSWLGGSDRARGQARHRSAGGEQLHCASFALYILIITILLYFISIIKLFLPQPTSFLIFTLLFLSPIPWQGE